MNRNLHNAMMAQYATPKVSGNGMVSWENGVKCVMPSVKLYGAAVQDGTPTPDAPIMPVCNDGAVKACGRNLLDISKFNLRTGGETVLFSDGVIVVQNGSPNATTLVMFETEFPPGTYTVSTNGAMRVISNSDEIPKATYNAFYNQYGYPYYTKDIAEILTFTLTNPAKFGFVPYGGDSIIYPQIELGTTPTPYTPYYDGGQARAPELWAIPGTDIRDEWDPQTGLGVRRCAVIESYDGEDITTPYISSTGELSEGAMVVCGIPDTHFTSAPVKLTMPNGYGQIIQVSGSVPNCPIEAAYLTHS